MEFHTNAEMVDISKLRPYEKNAKKHPLEQIKKLAAHIKRVGWDVPIVVDEEFIILKGHGRLAAAKRLKLKKVPVIVKTGLSQSQKIAVRIADNKLAESGWEEELLKLDLKSLTNELEDLGDLGFSEADLDAMGFDEVDGGEGKKKGRMGEVLNEEYLIVVTCEDEMQQAELFQEFSERELEVKMI